MSIYSKAYLACKLAEESNSLREVDQALQALRELLNTLGTGDLAMVVNIAQDYVGENSHLMEKEEVEDLRGAIERLEKVYE